MVRALASLLVFVLAPRGFSPGSPVFHSRPQEPTFPNYNSIGRVSLYFILTLKIEKINLTKTALYQQHVFIKDGAY